jgi:MraZ protein
VAVFLSSFVNRLDKKGRVSVPASFRAALGVEASGIMVFRALHHDALDACSPAHLEKLSQSIETLDLAPEVFELIETTIFGGAQFLPFDSEGRIGLPTNLAEAVGIDEAITFVGRRTTFQLWEPAKFDTHSNAMRSAAKLHDISLSKIIAQASLKPNLKQGGAL